jgi:hypothetical protein
MAQTRQRRVDSFSRQQEAQACGGHGVHSACLHAGDPDEFKPEYIHESSPCGASGKCSLRDPRLLEGSVMPIVYQY